LKSGRCLLPFFHAGWRVWIKQIGLGMSTQDQAAIGLSIRQPWATLLVCGLKSVEVRAWPTDRRGKILIHASRTPDDRRIGWDLVPAEYDRMANLRGGIIGISELMGCLVYRTAESFSADQKRHLNDPSWFRGRVLYGFTFAEPKPLPFRRYPGWMRFFMVHKENPRTGDVRHFPEFLANDL
jgi:hypothetical protein